MILGLDLMSGRVVDLDYETLVRSHYPRLYAGVMDLANKPTVIDGPRSLGDVLEEGKIPDKS